MFTRILILSVSCALPLGAQDARTVTTSGLAEIDGQLLGVGPRYEVEFQQGGIRFVPALGSDAPRLMPLSFELTSIERRGAAVWGGDAVRAVPQSSERSVRYVHSAGILERYDVRPDGVEQSFVFRERPAGRGDLVVRGRITTDLVPDAAVDSTSGSLTFRSTHGGVTFGAVTGIDAAGAHAAGSMRFANGELELVLPGSFVDHARYPLVLDPLIGTTTTIVGGSVNQTEPDVAYDATNDVYLVVWTEDFSTGRAAVRAQRVRPNGSIVGGPLTLSSGQVLAHRPRVGNAAASDRFVVVWEESGSAFGVARIRCRTVAAASGSASVMITLAEGNESRITPDVSNGVDRVLTTWTRHVPGSSVHVGQVVVSPTGDPQLGLVFSVSAQVTADDAGPKLSRCATANQIHTLVFRRDRRLMAVAVRNTTFPAAAGPQIELSPWAFDAAVDGDGSEFVVAYAAPRNVIADPHDVYGRSLRWNGSSLTALAAIHQFAVNANVDERSPAVAHVGDKTFVAWMRQEPTPLNYTVRMRGFHPGTCAECGLEYTLGRTGAYNALPALASSDCVPGGVDHGMAVFTSMAGAPGFQGDILAQPFEALGAGGVITDRGGSCGPGGVQTASGPFALGNPTFSLDLNGAGAVASLAAIQFAFPPVTPIQCGTCFFTPPIVSIPVAIVNGNASLPLRVTCDGRLVGARLESQFLTIGHPTSQCTLAPNIAVSNRLDATIGR